MWYCRKKLWAIVALCIGVGLIAGAYFAFWRAFMAGVVCVGVCIYLCMNT
ncbi:MAG: hypothetical protein IJL89_02035 [Firmicutes bacterium]|nr:hypothetical protein [Bacillota bacterium]